MNETEKIVETENEKLMKDLGFSPKCTVNDFLSTLKDPNKVEAIKSQLRLLALRSQKYDSINDVLKEDYGIYLRAQMLFNKHYNVPSSADFLESK